MVVILFLIMGLVFISIVLTLVKALIANIIICEGIIVAAILGVICGTTWGVHPALCIIIGIAICLVFIALHKLKVGFWIITPIMTAAWIYLFGEFTYDHSNGDWIWTIVVGAISAVCILGLHLRARMILKASTANQNTDIPQE